MNDRKLTHRWLISLFFILLLFQPASHGLYSSETKAETGFLNVYFVDVGQGDAIFIDLFGKKSVLIDSGPPNQFSNFFYKKKKGITRFLNKRGVRKLDLYILSHAHSDHIGGLKRLLKHIKIKSLYDPGFAFASRDYETCLRLVEKQKVDYKIVREGLKQEISGVTFEVLSPKKLFRHTRSDANSNSLVVKMTYKNISFLFPGDIEQEAEYRLLSHKEKLRSTFLKSPHHGSESSNTLDFIKLVQPKAVFISCGKNNIFGHPSAETVKRYEKLKVNVYRTDIHGSVRVKTNGHSYEISHENEISVSQSD